MSLPVLTEMAAALAGAIQLARLDPAGLTLFNRTLAGFWRSFLAALLVLPGYAIMVIASGEIPPGVGVLRAVLVEGIAYALRWLAFPFVMLLVVDILGRRDRYFDYMVPYNWTNVPQVILLLIVTGLTGGGVIPGRVGTLLSLVAYGSILIYLWFVARIGLKVTGLVAVALVLLDLVIGFSIGAVTQSLLRPGI